MKRKATTVAATTEILPEPTVDRPAGSPTFVHIVGIIIQPHNSSEERIVPYT
ncbi:hypothetical protein DPMN_090836, partial [Dreissena polymorpha]